MHPLVHSLPQAHCSHRVCPVSTAFMLHEAVPSRTCLALARAWWLCSPSSRAKWSSRRSRCWLLTSRNCLRRFVACSTGAEVKGKLPACSLPARAPPPAALAELSQPALSTDRRHAHPLLHSFPPCWPCPLQVRALAAQHTLDPTFLAVAVAFTRASAEAQQAVLELYCADAEGREDHGLWRAVCAAARVAPQLADLPGCAGLRQLDEAVLRRVLLTWAHTAHSFQRSLSAVFKTASRLNHSCDRNRHYLSWPDTGAGAGGSAVQAACTATLPSASGQRRVRTTMHRTLPCFALQPARGGWRCGTSQLASRSPRAIS